MSADEQRLNPEVTIAQGKTPKAKPCIYATCQLCGTQKDITRAARSMGLLIKAANGFMHEHQRNKRCLDTH